MKKTLALLLAAAFAVPAFAGNIFSNVETYGEIETIGFMTSSKDENGTKSVANRTLFGMSADLVEDVRANLTFAYTNIWEGTEGAAVSEEYDEVGYTGEGYLQRIRVAEANVVVSNIFGALEAKIGRQFYGNEDSPVMYIGPKHNLYVTIDDLNSIDGALVSYAGESFAMSALYAQLRDQDYSDPLNPIEHARMTGLTFDYAFNNNLTAGVYWYDLLDQEESQNHTGIWGGKVAYQNEEAKLGVEYAKNYVGHVFGHNNEGWMLKADAAMNLDMEKVALTPRVTYYHEEKGFEENGNYAPGIIIGNMKATIDNNPLIPALDYRILNAGIDFGFKALEKVTFSFDYLNAKLDNHWIGNEYDLTAKYQHNDYVTFTLGGGVIANMTDTPDAYAAQLGMLIKF